MVVCAIGTTPQEPNPAQLTAEAEAAYQRKEHKLAVELADRAIAAGSEDPETFQAKAVSLGELKRFTAFESAMDELIARVPQDSEPLAYKALVLAMANKDLPIALEAAERAIEVGPKNSHSWHSLAAVRYAEERYPEAVVAARESVAIPDAYDVDFLMLYRAAFKNEERNEAVAALEKGLEKHPHSAVLLTGLAWRKIDAEEYEDARSLVDRAEEITPRSPDVLSAKGTLLFRQEAYGKSALVFRELTEVSPDDVSVWLVLGQAYRLNDELDRALATLEHAEDLERAAADLDEATLSLIKQERASSLLMLGDDSAALKLAEELLEERSNDLNTTWYLKGWAERELGLIGDSIASLRKALSLSHFKDPLDWQQLGRSYRANGQHHNAWRVLSEAVRLDPRSEDIAIELAVESIDGHEYSRALQELQAAEDKHGKSGLIEYNRGVAQQRLGHTEEACGSWRRALEFDPPYLPAEPLLGRYCKSNAQQGGWFEYWIGAGTGGAQKAAGAVLALGLAAFLVLPLLKSTVIPGVVTGSVSVQSYIPAFALLLLLVLPTIRGFSFGGLKVDVNPRSPDEPSERINLQAVALLREGDFGSAGFALPRLV